jgi:hypothetical protein
MPLFECGHPDAEIAEVSQKSQKAIEWNSFFDWLFFCDFCVIFATSASGTRIRVCS